MTDYSFAPTEHARDRAIDSRAGGSVWFQRLIEDGAAVLYPDYADRLMPDKAIAGMLNRMGKRTGRLNGWTEARVRSFRNTHGIAVYREGEWAERGEITLTEAASMLDLSPMTVLRHIKAGLIPAQQHCKGAPWVIKQHDVQDEHLIGRLKAGANRPPSANPDQQSLIFQ